jgi:hypothetical protein
MRLNELADPSPYTLSNADATDLKKRLEGIWPSDEHQRLKTVIPRFQGRQSHRQQRSSHSRPRSAMTVRTAERRPIVVR